MANVNLNVAVRRDWPLANPWAWLSAGLGFVVWSWAWTAYFAPDASETRLLVLVFGLLLAAVGVWMRQGDRETVYLAPPAPILAIGLRLLVGGLFAFLALGVTLLLIASLLYPADVTERSGVWTRFIGVMERNFGTHVGPAILIWLSLFPLTIGAAKRCLMRKPGAPILSAEEERGVAFCGLAACCFLGTFTLLRDVEDPLDWDSMRLFLHIACVVCLYAAGLTLVAPGWRRLILSLLFVLHFAGISSACLSAPPAPWFVQQAWMRLFRPYLEFMYLNNAYHFYAPEPGPSSYLWFRIIYTTDDGKSDFGVWHKLPQIDHHGRIKHPVALEYQRYLSLTESIAQTDALPSEMIFVPDKGWVPRPMYMNRLNLAEGTGIIVGQDQKRHWRIPLHPEILKTQQVNIPGDGPKRLLRSFARHIAQKYPTYTDDFGRPMKFKSVKAYRVIHAIPPILWFQTDLPPTDPTLYRPFYVGNYDVNGHEINDGDPYLYWLLPILADRPADPNSDIKDYCRLHAGDPSWSRKRGDFD